MDYPSIASNLMTLATLKSLVWICLHEHVLSLIQEAPLEFIQYGQSWDTNKLVASVKYIWVLAISLDTYLEVD